MEMTRLRSRIHAPHWVLVDSHTQIILWPIVLVTALTIGSCLIKALFAVKIPYLSPYVAGVLVIASRVCLRSGLLAAAMSIAAYCYFFSHTPFAWDWPTPPEWTAYVSMVVGVFLVAPRALPVPPEDPVKDTDPLPFTSKNGDNGRSLHGNGRRYWDVVPSGVWSDDCDVGTAYARVYADRTKRRRQSPLFCWIIRDMVIRSQWTGVEAGFVEEIMRQGVSRPQI